MSVRPTRLQRVRTGETITADMYNKLLDQVERMHVTAGQGTSNFSAGGVKNVGNPYQGRTLFVQIAESLPAREEETSEHYGLPAYILYFDTEKNKWTFDEDHKIEVFADPFLDLPFGAGERIMVHYDKQSGYWLPQSIMQTRIIRTKRNTESKCTASEDPKRKGYPTRAMATNMFPFEHLSLGYSTGDAKIGFQKPALFPNACHYPAVGVEFEGFGQNHPFRPQDVVINLNTNTEDNYIPEGTEVIAHCIFNKLGELRWFTYVGCREEESSNSSSSSDLSSNSSSSPSSSSSSSYSSSSSSSFSSSSSSSSHSSSTSSSSSSSSHSSSSSNSSSSSSSSSESSYSSESSGSSQSSSSSSQSLSSSSGSSKSSASSDSSSSISSSSSSQSISSSSNSSTSSSMSSSTLSSSSTSSSDSSDSSSTQSSSSTSSSDSSPSSSTSSSSGGSSSSSSTSTSNSSSSSLSSTSTSQSTSSFSTSSASESSSSVRHCLVYGPPSSLTNPAFGSCNLTLSKFEINGNGECLFVGVDQFNFCTCDCDDESSWSTASESSWSTQSESSWSTQSESSWSFDDCLPSCDKSDSSLGHSSESSLGHSSESSLMFSSDSSLMFSSSSSGGSSVSSSSSSEDITSVSSASSQTSTSSIYDGDDGGGGGCTGSCEYIWDGSVWYLDSNTCSCNCYPPSSPGSVPTEGQNGTCE